MGRCCPSLMGGFVGSKKRGNGGGSEGEDGM